MRGRIRIALLLSALVAVALASSGQSQGPAGGSPPGLAVALAVKERNAERLLDKPGIAGVGVGVNEAGKAVIEIYREKQDVADVPSSLEGVDVESVVTGIIEARAPTDRFPRPVPIGVSSGLAGVATGTLGVRVTDGTNVYALSNNHVFAGINTASIGDPIIQPGDVDGGNDPADRIGTLYAYQEIDFNGGNNTMDAALALTTSANTGTTTPSDGYGTPSNVTTAAAIGQAVQKYGRTTGLQLGSVAATNVTVDVCYLVIFEFCLQEARFVGQISVSPGTFSAPGDSGSLIVTQGGNQPVALLFAGGDGLTIGSPIDPILQRFGVTIDGTPPGDGPPGAPTALSALAGDGSVSLSWNAPSFDGGSELTGYGVYRGTSPGSETFLESTGTGTSFVDSTAQNGTTYYYKVSAENVLGEGPLSNEAQATPSDLVPPVLPLPTLDSFNRPDEFPVSDAGRWSGATGVNGTAEGCLKVVSNQLASNKTTTCTGFRSNTQYGPDTEVWTKIGVLPGANNHIRLKARLQQVGTTGYDGYMLRTNQLAGADEVALERIDNGVFVRLLTLNRELAAGDTLLLRVHGSTLEAWHSDGTTWARLGTTSDSTYPGAGYVGIGLRGLTGRLDDFGARGGSATPPGVPTGLSAFAGDASATLSWTAPTFDGGSALTGYRVYRGTTPGNESFLQSVGTVTSFADSGLTNGQTYYYRVSAVNAVGEGPLSSEAQATPNGLDPPTPPLVSLDDFNRPNETPLSDQGRWTNAVNGGVENGLHVNSNQLACTATTTCTAWRSNAQYGPDVEVWTRVTVLLGTNNHIRLYGRLRQPGSAAYDAYLLRTNQLAGTDEVYLERIDNGAHTRLATINRELAVGDMLLLRVEGSTVEGWLNDGSSWTRLGTANDSTYPAAGFVGIGLRGTTGRLDDFGGRTMGVTPPAPQITTTTLPDATTGQAYSQTLAASGGTPPYGPWATVSGSLPPGLTLNSSTGAIAGTATTPGSYSFTVEVTDSGAQTDTQALTLDVRDPLLITTTSLGGGTAGQAYSASVQASGGKTPYTWSLAGGSLPPGLALSSTTGAITGTPTTAGTYPFTVRADDSGTPARSDTQALSIVIGAPPAPQITTTTLPDATTGQAYSQTLAASGGTPPYGPWATVSGSLPPGLTLNSSTGAIAGTATTPGSYSFTVEVTDSGAQTDTQALTLDVRDPLLITTTSLGGGTAGQAYSASVQASGGKTPYTWSLAGGSLPPGLALSSTTGAITGTPTTAGTYPFTVRADDSGTPARSDTQALSIQVQPATTLAVATTTLPDGTVGAAYSAALAATGGVSPYTWAVVSGALPPGVSLVAATGALTGTPTKQGRYTFTVRVTDANGAQATRALSIRIRR